MIGDNRSYGLGMGNGITYTVESQNDAYVIIREHIDLTHPDCPVVCLDKDARWAIVSKQMTRQEFDHQFGDAKG